MSQMRQVIEKLEDTGAVSRNWGLKKYISRLSAIIYDLKNEYGWEFEGKRVEVVKPDGNKGWDYIYILIKKGKNPYKGKNKTERD